jgi:hypothetical protein
MESIGHVECDSEHHDDNKCDHAAATHSRSVPYSIPVRANPLAEVIHTLDRPPLPEPAAAQAPEWAHRRAAVPVRDPPAVIGVGGGRGPVS